jgi:hypothetical protein
MKLLLVAATCFLLSSYCLQAGPIGKLPFKITKPGKYFLIKNLTPVAKPGATAAITVLASNVELDLGGFSILVNPAAPAITTGIAIAAEADEVRVRNGRVSGFEKGLVSDHDAHDSLFEQLEVKSPASGGFLQSKGTRVRACGFILTSATGTGLEVSSGGGGPAHTIESCNFYATVAGVAATQIAIKVSGGAPTVVRDCQFITWGQGILGNGSTKIADNLFQECVVTHTNTTAVGFNQ